MSSIFITLGIVGNLTCSSFSLLFFKRFLFIFRVRGGKIQREGEKHQCVVASCTSYTGDLACNPGMCSNWELNWWPIGSQAGVQSTEPHRPRPLSLKKNYFNPCSVTVVPISLHYCPLPYPPPASHIESSPTIVFVHGSFIHVLWLDPSPSFPITPLMCSFNLDE